MLREYFSGVPAESLSKRYGYSIVKITYPRNIIVNRYQDFFVLTTYCSTSVNLYQD